MDAEPTEPARGGTEVFEGVLPLMVHGSSLLLVLCSRLIKYMDKKFDIFISHASEDKDAIVRPLATILERLSVRVWYDEFSLQLGDSLTASIDNGLQESKYGLVVLSKAFLSKRWPEYEYRSLMTREIDGERVILPLWYDVTKEDVKTFSLYLADIKALPISTDNLGNIVPAILKVVRPD